MERNIIIVCLACFAGASSAQSVLLQALEPTAPMTEAEKNNSQFAHASLLYVRPPEPRTFIAHDLITIIIDETSKQAASQTLDTSKDVSNAVGLNAILDPWQLLELRLRQGDLSNQSLLDLNTKNSFKGEGDYERSDRFSARITAEVLEVKPNGTLVLQATKVIEKDDETQTLVLAGVARQEDVTNRNTIMSSQLANLSLTVKNEGELRKSAEKGLLTRVLEAVFNF